MNQHRHPAGTSVGGQWAPGSASEVESELTEVRETPDFAGSDDHDLIVNSEQRSNARMIRGVISHFRSDDPGIKYIKVIDNGAGGVDLDGIQNADGTFSYDIPDQLLEVTDGRGRPDPVQQLELNAYFSAVKAEYPGGIEGIDDDVAWIDCDRPPVVPPRLHDSPPSSAMHGVAAGRLWSPVLDESGTGYRRDQIRVGDQTVEIAGNEQQTAEISFYERQARQDGDFFSSMPASPVTERA